MSSKNIEDVFRKLFIRLRNENIETEKFMVVQDIINHSYRTNAYSRYMIKNYLLGLGFVVPLFLTLLNVITSKPGIKVAMSLCIVTQVYFFKSEIMV